MKNISTLPETKSPRDPAGKADEAFNPKIFEDFYVKNDFKAAASYLIQNKQQLKSGIFHYNLGTVYSKMGDMAAARFHLEKAIKDGHINSSTLNNLSFVKTQLQVDDLSTSSNLYDQVMNSALAFPSSAYLTLTLVLVLAAMVLLRMKKIIGRISFAICLVFALVPIYFSTIYLKDINYAIAFKDIPIYEGPSKIFSEKGKVRAGSKMILGEFKEGWFYVKYPISLAGWVGKDQLGLY